jgi:hypothetical protein
MRGQRLDRGPQWCVLSAGNHDAAIKPIQNGTEKATPAWRDRTPSLALTHATGCATVPAPP